MILALVMVLLSATSVWSADLTVRWTTAPGAQDSIELAVWGEGAKGPDDAKAIRVTAAVNTTSRVIKGTDIEAAFPGTTFVGVTARKKGDTTWWAHADGSYQYQLWPSSVIVQPPVDPPVIVPPIVKTPTMEDVNNAIAASATNVRAGLVAEYKAALATNNMRQALALDKCLTNKPNTLTCVRALRDALKVAP